jgi:hypothetical protein
MKKNSLFTFILDWKGGTYISQVSSETLNKAITTWADGFSFDEIGVKNIVKSKFIVDVNNEVVEPVNGLKNVWCISPNIGDVMAIVHITETIAE